MNPFVEFIIANNLQTEGFNSWIQDAWNAALDWAAENAKTKQQQDKWATEWNSNHYETVVDKQSILKGKV